MPRLLAEGLLKRPLTESAPSPGGIAALGSKFEAVARKRLGRSLSIRHVDVGSCNACELEIHALNNAYYDLERFGLRFVASPRHADVLLVTGPVTLNMKEALLRTYAATPAPKWVVAAGACAIDGGLFAGGYACLGGVADAIPVDLRIRGCPPSPTALLAGLLTLMEGAPVPSSPPPTLPSAPRKILLPLTIELGRDEPGDSGVRPLVVLIGVAEAEALAISRLESYFSDQRDQLAPLTAWLWDERNVLIAEFRVGADGRASKVTPSP